jgi:hypothetical protein
LERMYLRLALTAFSRGKQRGILCPGWRGRSPTVRIGICLGPHSLFLAVVARPFHGSAFNNHDRQVETP